MGTKLAAPVACPTCSVAFVRLSGKQKYCTPACSPWLRYSKKKKAYIKPSPKDTNWVPSEKACLTCGEAFLPTASHQRYCAEACQGWQYTPEFRRKRTLGKYGLTPDQYDRMLAAQGGGCAVCSRSDEVLAVDHDHACCPGQASCGACVRGLLCRACNQALGNLGDDYSRILDLATYLLSFRSVLDPEGCAISSQQQRFSIAAPSTLTMPAG